MKELHGTGTARVADLDIGPVTYRLDISLPSDREMGEASGVIVGDADALAQAFKDHAKVHVRRDDTGEKFACYISHFDNSQWHITVTGSPGSLL